jgi:hypothetical protein
LATCLGDFSVKSLAKYRGRGLIDMHGCHPFTAALSLSVMAGTSFTHVFPLPASAKAYLAHVAPSLPAWCRPCANDAAVFQRPARPNVARVVHVSVAPRARRVRRSRFHHQQISGGSSPKILGGGPAPGASIPSSPFFLPPLPSLPTSIPSPFPVFYSPPIPLPILPFPLPLPSSSLPIPFPFERGSGGITPGKIFRIKDDRRWILEHFGHDNNIFMNQVF